MPTPSWAGDSNIEGENMTTTFTKYVLVGETMKRMHVQIGRSYYACDSQAWFDANGIEYSQADVWDSAEQAIKELESRRDEYKRNAEKYDRCIESAKKLKQKFAYHIVWNVSACNNDIHESNVVAILVYDSQDPDAGRQRATLATVQYNDGDKYTKWHAFGGLPSNTWLKSLNRVALNPNSSSYEWFWEYWTGGMEHSTHVLKERFMHLEDSSNVPCDDPMLCNFNVNRVFWDCQNVQDVKARLETLIDVWLDATFGKENIEQLPARV